MGKKKTNSGFVKSSPSEPGAGHQKNEPRPAERAGAPKPLPFKPKRKKEA